MLVGLSETSIEPTDQTSVEIRSGDIPDLSKFAWNSAILDWYAKYKRILTKKEFLKKFTPEEYGKIKSATATDTTVDYYWQLFTLAEELDMEDADTIVGINLLEQAQLIGIGRAHEILST